MTLLLLTGCILGTDLAGLVPTVTFDKLTLTAIDFERISVNFDFNVDNPNPVGISPQRFAYGLSLADVELLSGDSPDGLSIAADGTSLVSLPVTLAFQDIYDFVDAVRGIDTLPFGLRGDFGWDTSIGPVDIAFDEGGEFPALRIPDFQFGQFNFSGVDGSAAEFALDLDVDNDHGSMLDFRDFAFDVSLGGTRVGQGETEELGSVEGASTKTLQLPISIDYADAIEAITSGKTDLGLEAEMSVDTPFGTVPLTIDESGNVKVGTVE